MKTWMKPICTLLTVSILFFYSVPAYSQEICLKSHEKGELDADENHSAIGWFAGGIVSGVTLGLIGTAVITGVSACSNPKPDSLTAP